MRRAGAVADTLAALAVTAWVGGHAALGAFAARIVFRELPRALAADTMTKIFASFDGLVLGAMIVLAVAAGLRAYALGVATRADRIALGAAVALVAVGALEVFYVSPMIQQLYRAGRTLDPAFASLHRLSERGGTVEVVLAAVLLGAHAWSRARSRS